MQDPSSSTYHRLLEFCSLECAARFVVNSQHLQSSIQVGFYSDALGVCLGAHHWTLLWDTQAEDCLVAAGISQACTPEGVTQLQVSTDLMLHVSSE